MAEVHTKFMQKKPGLLLSFFSTIWVKEPRQSETLSHEKLYLYRCVRHVPEMTTSLVPGYVWPRYSFSSTVPTRNASPLFGGEIYGGRTLGRIKK